MSTKKGRAVWGSRKLDNSRENPGANQAVDSFNKAPDQIHNERVVSQQDLRQATTKTMGNNGIDLDMGDKQGTDDGFVKY